MNVKINLDQITHSSVHRITEERLVFGNIFSDHMLVRQFENGNWGDANIVPRAPMQIDPTTLALHYGQAVFEGLKAYRNTEDQSIQLFRPEANGRRQYIGGVITGSATGTRWDQSNREIDFFDVKGHVESLMTGVCSKR